MAIKTVGIKDLKKRNGLSYCLREVKKGEKILDTNRGQVIVTILPVEKEKGDSKLLSLVKEGLPHGEGENRTRSAQISIFKL